MRNLTLGVNNIVHNNANLLQGVYRLCRDRTRLLLIADGLRWLKMHKILPGCLLLSEMSIRLGQMWMMDKNCAASRPLRAVWTDTIAPHTSHLSPQAAYIFILFKGNFMVRLPVCQAVNVLLLVKTPHNTA